MSSLSEQKPMRLWPSPIVYCEERGLTVSISAISLQPILTSQTLHAAQSLITLCLPPALLLDADTNKTPSASKANESGQPARRQVNQQDARGSAASFVSLAAALDQSKENAFAKWVTFTHRLHQHPVGQKGMGSVAPHRKRSAWSI